MFDYLNFKKICKNHFIWDKKVFLSILSISVTAWKKKLVESCSDFSTQNQWSQKKNTMGLFLRKMNDRRERRCRTRK